MSDPPSLPLGEGPTNHLRTLPAPPWSKQHISMPQPTPGVGAMATPWNTTQDEDPEARRREHLRRHYEQSNPYDTSRFAGSLDRDRSRSPLALPSPLHQRTPLPETSQLPPLSDILTGPFNGVQQQDSYMRSTAQRTCAPNVLSSPTPVCSPGEGKSVQRRQHPDLPPLSDLPSPSDFTPLPTPSHARQNIDQPVSPATTEPGENGTPCPTTNAAVKAEMELDPKEEEDADDKVSKYSIVCEFSSPCHMTPSPDGMHYRKVVSHVFGRNKASTKLFPDAVWVHYCRKHYQRARYRADQWPFTQCELLLESINRMEEWGGVHKFELILRRREILRVEDGETARGRKAGSPNSLHSGRKHPTAVVSPVPDWLRERCGREMSFDDIRNLVVEIRGYMVELREEEKERQGQQETAAGNASSSKGFDHSSGKSEGRQQASRVRFPDVEILPKFKKWVIDAALRKRASQPNVVQRADDDEAEVESLSDIGDDDMDEDGEKKTPTGEVGRTGTNNGPSPSQRRRSERIFLRMVEGKGVARVSARGAVEKPRGKK